MGKFDLNIGIDTSLFEDELEALSDNLQLRVQEAIQLVAESAYVRIYNNASEKGISHKHVQDYLQNLNFKKVTDSEWLISLKGDYANQLEEGIPAYSMKEKQLRSNKLVTEGARAGQPWVRRSKAGNRYAAVPLAQKLAGVNKSDLASTLRSLEAKGRNGVVQNITKTFTDLNTGQPLLGKVATAANTGIANLENLVKYQSMTKSGKVKSIYMIYRSMSERPGTSAWNHSGYPAIRGFEGIEEFIDSALSDILEGLGE